MTLPARFSTDLFLRLIIVLGALLIGAPPASARVFDPETGRFLQRDPLGYVDGPNPYCYVNSRPIFARDPRGLAMSEGSGGCREGACVLPRQGFGVFPPRLPPMPPVFEPPTPGSPPSDAERFCQRVCATPDDKGVFPYAEVTCWQGQLIICYCRSRIEHDYPTIGARLRSCILLQEWTNSLITRCNPDPEPIPSDDVCLVTCNEALAYELMLSCIARIDCGGDPACVAEKQALLDTYTPHAQALRQRCIRCRQTFP